MDLHSSNWGSPLFIKIRKYSLSIIENYGDWCNIGEVQKSNCVDPLWFSKMHSCKHMRNRMSDGVLYTSEDIITWVHSDAYFWRQRGQEQSFSLTNAMSLYVGLATSANIEIVSLTRRSTGRV